MHVQSTTTLIHHFHCQLLSVLAGEPHLSKSLLCVLTARVATWCGAETRLSDPADRRAASTKASRPLSHQNREQCSLGLPFFHLVRRGLASSPAERGWLGVVLLRIIRHLHRGCKERLAVLGIALLRSVVEFVIRDRVRHRYTH